MRNYRSKIKLPNGKYAYTQTDVFKDRGCNIKREILKRWTPPKYFYHYKNGGHLSATRAHLNGELFTKIDIKAFYPSITKNKIIRSLKKTKISRTNTFEFAAESVVSAEGKLVLPYGFVQSPIISSLVLHKSCVGRIFDNCPNSLKMTVYVDDIIISSTKANIDTLKNYGEQLCIAVNQANFKINKEKSIFEVPKIEAFNINISHNDMDITKEKMSDFYKRVKADPASNEALGITNYVKQVNQQQGKFLDSLMP